MTIFTFLFKIKQYETENELKHTLATKMIQSRLYRILPTHVLIVDNSK
jgi:hypothetical protein